MPDPVIAQLCGAVSADTMMENLRELARWVKLAGTAEEIESLLGVEARMRSYGYRTEVLVHDAYISLPGPARVEAGGRTLACITHSFSRASPPAGLRSALVHVGAGGEADFAARDVRDRIVLVDGMATPPVSARASRAGAIGQLHVTPDPHLHEMCISPVWGSPSAETLADLPATVAVTIGRDDGAALRDRLAAGEAVEVVLHAEVDTGWRATPILVAEMDGPDASADAPFVMFSGHHDTWYHGVMDNGAANATMMEVARLCATRRGEWKRGLRLCFWSGHSQGRYSGSAWYADAHWDELDRRCVVHVNTDSTGGRGSSVLNHSGAATELWGLAREVIAARAGQDYAGHRTGRQGDESFWGIGIPALFNSLSHHAITPDYPYPHLKLGWWWHTAEDTLDKIDPDNLVRDTRIFVHAVWRLLAAEVVPFDHAAQARSLGAELDALATALGPRFDLSALQQATTALEAEAERVAARARTATGAEAAAINRALMRVCRALVPIDYTRGDRFVHDPATPLPAWPSLQPLRTLAALADGDAATRFQHVSAMRAGNRVRHALRTATEALRGID